MIEGLKKGDRVRIGSHTQKHRDSWGVVTEVTYSNVWGKVRKAYVGSCDVYIPAPTSILLRSVKHESITETAIQLVMF